MCDVYDKRIYKNCIIKINKERNSKNRTLRVVTLDLLFTDLTVC